MKKGDVKFCSFIGDVLKRAESNGKFQEAWKKTLGQVQPQAPALPKFITCA
jgi:glutamate transport system substrate-binding protein